MAATPITIHADAPLVALQDGDGPWTALQGSGGVYQARVVGPRYAVASACPSFSETDYDYRTVADPTEFDGLHCTSAAPDVVSVTITTTGFDSQSHNIIFVGRSGFDALSGNGSHTIPLLKGPADVIVSSQVPLQPTVFYRGGPIDFEQAQTLLLDGTLALPTEQFMVTVSDTNVAATDNINAGASYVTATSHTTAGTSSVPAAPNEPAPYHTIAASLRHPGDLISVNAFTSRNDGTERTYHRSVLQRMSAPGSPTLTLPPELVPTTPTLAPGPDPQITWNIPAGPSAFAVTEYLAIAFTGDQQAFRSNFFAISSTWAARQTSLAITTPDLSGLPGWTADLALDVTQPLKWGVEREDHDAGSAFVAGYHATTSLACAPALPTFAPSDPHPLDLLRRSAREAP